MLNTAGYCADISWTNRPFNNHYTTAAYGYHIIAHFYFLHLVQRGVSDNDIFIWLFFCPSVVQNVINKPCLEAAQFAEVCVRVSKNQTHSQWSCKRDMNNQGFSVCV